MNDTGRSVEQPALSTEPQVLSYAPAAAWVQADPAPIVPGEGLEDFTDQGVLRILHDAQTSLLEAGAAVHMRALQRILTRTGAERAANITLEFDPTHERLEIHSICVWREGQPIEYARPNAMQLLRRESQLERLTLNGRLTASFVVPDLREGDQLEIRFTQLTGQPVLSGRFGGWLTFNGYAPWIETRARLVRPLSRAVSLKPFNSPPAAEVRTEGDREEQRWSLFRQRRIAIEDLMPPWTIKNPCYQVSEFATWGEVAQLFAPHYQDGVLPDGLRAACADLAAARMDPPTLAVEWLRFVQRTLRYFALALGDGGLLPRDLETIWTRRFADCKDAARFYVAGARHLGLDASAALVSTTHGMSLNAFLPSAHVFNHVVVRLRIGDKTYWLDPTLPPQAGSLEQLVTSHAGWALPLTADTQALEALPEAAPVEIIRCEDHLTLGQKPESTATLERRFELRFWAADNVRNRIANEGPAKLATQLLQDLLGNWPRAAETKPPAFEEDKQSNTLTMRFAYEIPNPWILAQDGKRWMLPLLDTVTHKELAKLQVTRRQGPVLLGRPRRASWRATVTMPRRWRGKGWQNVFEEPGLRFTGNLKFSGKEVIVDRELTVSAWSMAADQADGYTRVVTKLNLNVTQLFARMELGRLVSAVSLWRRLLGSRRRRLTIIIIFWIIYVVVSNAMSHH
jgi:hypothetical protein